MFLTIKDIIKKDANTALLLIDIGAMGFCDLLTEIPERAMNIGIFEPGTVGIAAGMSLRGITPIIYGISPFIVERALEQLKLDFAYQKLGGNFVTTGAAYDFSTLGYSHYCAEDIGILRLIPGFEFIAPGTPKQFDVLFRETYSNGNPTYFRLSDYSNRTECQVSFGRANIIKKGSKATVIAVSTMLDAVMEACFNEDVTILYYTTLVPFDHFTLRENCPSKKVLLCEPHYSGALVEEVIESLAPDPVRIEAIGIPRKIIRDYGTKLEKDIAYGFTPNNISDRVKKLINEN